MGPSFRPAYFVSTTKCFGKAEYSGPRFYRLKTITGSDCDLLTFEITFAAVLCQRLLNPKTLEIALLRILDRAGVRPADSGNPLKLNARPN